MKSYEISGFEVMEYEEAVSTNTLAEGIPFKEWRDRTVVLTYRQTGGRGQASNRWESEAGKNISMTVVLKPAGLEAGKQFAVSMVVALGVLDFVRSRVGRGTVKWPNDVYVEDRKVAGILIEHRIAGAYVQGSLCGIGLNINQEEFLSDAPNPVSLYQLTGREEALETALGDLLAAIGGRYALMGDEAGLRRSFREELYRGQGVYAWEDAGGVFEAGIEGIDEYGQLVLRDVSGGRRVYGFKEVRYL